MRLLCSALLVLSVAEALPAAAQELKTEEDKTYYALGVLLSNQIKMFELNKTQAKLVAQGLQDSVTGAKLAVQPDAYRPRISELAQKSQAKLQEKQAAEAKNIKAKGKEYADKAAKEKGAVKTASGLVYKELTAGKGASPKAEDTVRVHYRGTLIDGKQFDSSYDRGQPAEFPLTGVIPCWTEGVQKMKVGGKSRLICPSDIAYGDGGTQGIPGGSTLVFEVELLEIKK